MLVLSLFLFATQLQFVADVPPPAIRAATVSSDGQCVVTLANVHVRPAVAWLVMNRDGTAGASTDRVLPDPSLWLQKNAEVTEHYPCRSTPGSVPDVVAVALYDDGTVSGDDATTKAAVESRILRSRSRTASGLRSLSQLIASRHLEAADTASLSEELRDVVSNSSGGSITSIPRAAAIHAVMRLSGETDLKTSTEDFRSRLVSDLRTLANAYEAFAIGSDGGAK